MTGDKSHFDSAQCDLRIICINIQVAVKSIKKLISDKIWAEISPWLEKAGLGDVFYALFDYIDDKLKDRIDDIKVVKGRMVSFFSEKREFLTINITRKDLRVYVHPPAGAYFEGGSSRMR